MPKTFGRGVRSDRRDPRERGGWRGRREKRDQFDQRGRRGRSSGDRGKGRGVGGGRGISRGRGRGRGGRGRGRGGRGGRGGMRRGRGGRFEREPVRKQLVRAIVDLLCKNGPMRAIRIAQELGFTAKFEINPTLYYMRRNHLAQQEDTVPPKWGLTDGYNHEYYRWSSNQGLIEEVDLEAEEFTDDEEEDEDDDETEEVMEKGDDEEVTEVGVVQASTDGGSSQSSTAIASATTTAMPSIQTREATQLFADLAGELTVEEKAQLMVLQAMKSRPLGTASVPQLEAKLQISPKDIMESLDAVKKRGLVSLVSKESSLWVLTSVGEDYVAKQSGSAGQVNTGSVVQPKAVAVGQSKTGAVGQTKTGSVGQVKTGSVGQAKTGSRRPLPPHLFMSVNPDFAPSQEESSLSCLSERSSGVVSSAASTSDEIPMDTEPSPQSSGKAVAAATPTSSVLKPSNRPRPPHEVERERTGKLPDKFIESKFYVYPKDGTALQPSRASAPLLKTHQFSTLSRESFAVLNKNPISTLMEYAQSQGLTASIDVLRTMGPPHKQRFVMAASIGDRQFPRVDKQNKKDARKEAADVAIRLLVEEGAFNKSKKKKKAESAAAVAGATYAAEPTGMETSSGTPYIAQMAAMETTSPGNAAVALSNESFAALNKNPISALMEYAQTRQTQAQIELLTQSGPSHAPKFVMAVTMNNRQFPWVTKSNKKEAKTAAAEAALRLLMSEGAYTANATQGPLEITPNMTHFDKIAALSHQAFNTLAAQITESFAGRKVIAAMVMKTSEDDDGRVISVGSGNRCITGDKLSLEGNTVNDSHAEIISRRGLLRFLYQQLLLYQPGQSHDLFEPTSSGKLKMKDGITFHLYISTAPCGDGALFSPRDCENRAITKDDTSREHRPTFTSNVQGLLRTKMEGGEGTIPIEADYQCQTFDGIQRGERLRTMSCTDKICRWNVVGMQGALLSHFLEPIYMESLTLGYLYDHGHLARAVCCRVGRGEPPISDRLPQGFRLNHPWLGRVTMCDPPRETQKTKANSVNWCMGDEGPEVLDGTMGICNTSIEKKLFSRVRKKALYDHFKEACQKFGRSDLLGLESYNEAKKLAVDFQAAKEAMLKVLAENKYGPWVGKPVEEGMFS